MLSVFTICKCVKGVGMTWTQLLCVLFTSRLVLIQNFFSLFSLYTFSFYLLCPSFLSCSAFSPFAAWWVFLSNAFLLLLVHFSYGAFPLALLAAQSQTKLCWFAFPLSVMAHRAVLKLLPQEWRQSDAGPLPLRISPTPANPWWLLSSP